jgi:hypothetical protein
VNELAAAASSAGVGGVVWCPLWSHMLMAPSWMPSVIGTSGDAAMAGTDMAAALATMLAAAITTAVRILLIADADGRAAVICAAAFSEVPGGFPAVMVSAVLTVIW